MPLMSLKYPTRPMWADEIRAVLGLPSKLPATQVPPTAVNGYWVRVLPLPPVPSPLPRKRRSGHRHRVQAQCHTCGRWIPFGRLGQHEPSCARRRLDRLNCILARRIAEGR